MSALKNGVRKASVMGGIALELLKYGGNSLIECLLKILSRCKILRQQIGRCRVSLQHKREKEIGVYVSLIEE